MNSVTSNTRRFVFGARLALVVSYALAVAACETDGTGPSATGAPKAEVAAGKPDADAPKTQAAKPAEPT